jgi:hypothetical protein
VVGVCLPPVVVGEEDELGLSISRYTVKIISRLVFGQGKSVTVWLVIDGPS